MLSTDKQTNRQTNQRYQKHNLLCQGGNKVCFLKLIPHPGTRLQRIYNSMPRVTERNARSCATRGQKSLSIFKKHTGTRYVKLIIRTRSTR